MSKKKTLKCRLCNKDLTEAVNKLGDRTFVKHWHANIHLSHVTAKLWDIVDLLTKDDAGDQDMLDALKLAYQMKNSRNNLTSIWIEEDIDVQLSLV